MRLCDVDKLHNVTKSSLMRYPIFDEGHRTGLNKKILDHYWMQEIAYETPDYFLFALRRKMNEIMPYYNKLYLSEQLEFDPLHTFDLSTVTDSTSETSDERNATRDDTTDQTSDSTNGSTVNSKSRSVTSEFPQNMLAGNGDYATGAGDSSGTTTTSGTGHDTAHSAAHGAEQATGQAEGKGHSETRQTGRTGSGAGLLMEYRASLLNVDMLVVYDVSQLFLNIWRNGDMAPGEPSYHS